MLRRIRNCRGYHHYYYYLISGKKSTFQIRQNYPVRFLPEPDICRIWKKCWIPAGARSEIRHGPSQHTCVLLIQVPTGSVHKSDMLPSGWNDGGGVYSMMYQRTEPSDSATYFLKVISIDGLLLVHLLVSTTVLLFIYF